MLPHDTKTIVELGRADKKTHLQPFSLIEQQILNSSKQFCFSWKPTVLFSSRYIFSFQSFQSVDWFCILDTLVDVCFLSLYIDSSVSKDTYLNKTFLALSLFYH